MELLCENDFGKFRVLVDGNFIFFTGEGCNIPVRVYVYSGVCEYAGLASGDEVYCELKYVSKSEPKKILLLNGRIDDEYEIIYEFDLVTPKNHQGIFDCKTLSECIKYYGHFISFVEGGAVVYAIPSDFSTHPVPELLKYAYWYDVDFGYGAKGYYFFGLYPDGKCFFITEDIYNRCCSFY